MAVAVAATDEVSFRSPIRGPSKIPRPFDALSYSKIWWPAADSDGASSDGDDEGPMGNYNEMGDESKDFMTLEEYYAANKTWFDKLIDCFAVFKRLVFGYSS